jgi:hypothetical protein
MTFQYNRTDKNEKRTNQYESQKKFAEVWHIKNNIKIINSRTKWQQ